MSDLTAPLPVQALPGERLDQLVFRALGRTSAAVEEVLAQFTKVAATSLSSGTIGQVFVGLMVTPPTPGEPSHALFARETAAIRDGLTRRAHRASAALNAMPGVSSASIDGAMYAFPSIELPPAFVAHAAKAAGASNGGGGAADEAWCVELLEATGIVCVPGSGFRQRAGTWHFRTTFLPPEGDMDSVIEQMAAFHADFMAQYK